MLFLSTLSLRRATLWSSKTGRRFPYFYPRSPCGERRGNRFAVVDILPISIHALLAESDTGDYLHYMRLYDFYPRSPCGERPIFAVRPYDAPIFLSTLSLRRATWTGGKIICRLVYFYPRSPCGERPILGIPNQVGTWISIHALLAESDRGRQPALSQSSAFLSTLSLRRATPAEHHANSQQEFLSTLSLRRATDRAYFTRKVKANFYPRSPCGERLTVHQ